MRTRIVALALALSSATALAQSDVDRFQGITSTITSDPLVAGQWIVLLPFIAQQCERVVDHERTALLINRFANPEAVDDAADYFASGPVSGLKADWDAIAHHDQAEACRLADRLWGETGTLTPGVLRDRPAAPSRIISQHASDDVTP